MNAKNISNYPKVRMSKFSILDLAKFHIRSLNTFRQSLKYFAVCCEFSSEDFFFVKCNFLDFVQKMVIFQILSKNGNFAQKSEFGHTS